MTIVYLIRGRKPPPLHPASDLTQPSWQPLEIFLSVVLYLQRSSKWSFIALFFQREIIILELQSFPIFPFFQMHIENFLKVGRSKAK
jgi:hypothetical protein